MAYTVVYTKQAVKGLTRAPRDIAGLIRNKLKQIAVEPFASHPNVTKLQNREGYRLRVGDWRVIYDIQKDRVIIFVLKVDVRGEVYR